MSITPPEHAREMAYIVSNSGAAVLIHGEAFAEGIDANRELFGGKLPIG